MAEYRIREYRDEDYAVVRELFSHGMSEYVPGVCVHVLRQPWVLFVMSCLFLSLLLSSRSLILPVLALTLLLALGRQLLGYCWTLYIERCLRDDLLDIRRTYMEAAGSRFWVAEAEDGAVVGTVGVKPSGDAPEELILKRMSVRKDWRGRGIAKALTREALGFARRGGFGSVVLNTLMVQREAQSLYRSAGFRKYRESALPTAYGRLVNFTIAKYRYELRPQS